MFYVWGKPGYYDGSNPYDSCGREPQDGGVYVSKLNWTLRSIS